MAVKSCPTLKNYTAEEMCNENKSGLGVIVYYGRKSELKAPLTATENVYSTPEFAEGKGLYKVECKDEGQEIVGSSLGPNKGNKIQLDLTVEMVNQITAIIGRAWGNYRDLFYIVKDGDVSQILYDPNRNCKIEQDGFKTTTGKAAGDDRVTTASIVLQPVNYANLYVTEPESGGWDSLLATVSA